MRIKSEYSYTDVRGNMVTAELVKVFEVTAASREMKMKYIQSLAELIGAIEPHQTLTVINPPTDEEEQFWNDLQLREDEDFLSHIEVWGKKDE